MGVAVMGKGVALPVATVVLVAAGTAGACAVRVVFTPATMVACRALAVAT